MEWSHGVESWSGAIKWHVGVAFWGGFKFLLPIPLFIKFTVYARDNINLGNSESFCKIILLIFELRHKNLLLFTKTKGAHQRVGL